MTSVLAWLRRRAPVRAVAEATRRWRSARLLRRSGLFDAAFYRAQLPADATVGGTDADAAPVSELVAHYLEVGAAAGLSPHPLFDPAWYLEHSPAARRSPAAPYVEFLDRGCHRELPPHPLFDAAAYLAAHPEAAGHPHGAFGHFLDQRRAPVPLPAELTGTSEPATVDPQRHARDAAAVREEVAARPGAPPPAASAEFDHDAATELVARVRAGTPQRPPVTVTVVLPTRNRRELVAEAIASVQAQTWRDWELVVVDDGGDDGTDELVGRLAATDPRIRYVHQDHGGVAAARNRGIAEGSGALVAYLDSDNTWVEEFLEVMVGVLLDGGHRAAYGASELHTGDGVRYRSEPFDPDRLLAGNHVDCITLVHERSLLDEVGRFDEDLERFVDWELLLRIAGVTRPQHVPFVATRYAVGEAATHDRITTTHSLGWRDVVQARHLVEWPSAAPRAGVASVVLVATAHTPDPVGWAARLCPPGDAAVEVVVVDAGLPVREACALRWLARRQPALRVVTPPVPVAPGVARVLGVAAAAGDVVVLAEPEARLRPTHVTALAASLRQHGLGVLAPLLVGTDDTVVSGPASLLSGGELLRWGRDTVPGDDAALGPYRRDEPGSDLDHDPDLDQAPGPVTAAPVTVEAVQQGVVALDALLARELHGPDPLLMEGGAVVELSLRAAAADRRVALAPDLVVPWDGPADRVGGRPHRRDRAALAHRWGGPPATASGLQAPAVVPLGDPGGGLPRRWDVVAGGRAATDAAATGADTGTATAGATPPRRRWSIATCVPDRAAAPAWGDWHFAQALRDALVQLGEHAVVDTVASRSRRSLGSEHVHVLLRGVNPVPAVPGRTNLLWVISHPEDVADRELRTADHVFVAGPDAVPGFTARADGTPVEPLLQCTDPTRFRPHPPGGGPELLFVGNSRGQHRPVLEDAAAAGLAPTVVGAGWDGLVPDAWIATEHVDNHRLPQLYASARVVLNDHWPDMRRAGIVSNRLFDAVAAGAVVVTDPVAGVGELFGDRVVTYDGSDELADAVARARSRDRADLTVAARVRTEHTFATRAAELVAAADRHADR